MGKSSINGPFSMAMLNNQRVVYQRLPTRIQASPEASPGAAFLPAPLAGVPYICHMLMYLDVFRCILRVYIIHISVLCKVSDISHILKESV